MTISISIREGFGELAHDNDCRFVENVCELRENHRMPLSGTGQHFHIFVNGILDTNPRYLVSVCAATKPDSVTINIKKQSKK